jgi:hypothetical protein
LTASQEETKQRKEKVIPRTEGGPEEENEENRLNKEIRF